MERDNSYLIGNQFAKGSKPNKTSFKVGSIPWNKGTKGIMKPNSGSFKKGQKSNNKMPIGTIVERNGKNNIIRKFIKISEPNKWIENAKFVWIKNNGLIPKGFLIHHIDENPLNDNIDNLAILTRKGHFEIHKIGEMGRNRLKEIYEAKLGNAEKEDSPGGT